jgi:hypothetical protein
MPYYLIFSTSSLIKSSKPLISAYFIRVGPTIDNWWSPSVVLIVVEATAKSRSPKSLPNVMVVLPVFC